MWIILKLSESSLSKTLSHKLRTENNRQDFENQVFFYPMIDHVSSDMWPFSYESDSPFSTQYPITYLRTGGPYPFPWRRTTPSLLYSLSRTFRQVPHLLLLGIRQPLLSPMFYHVPSDRCPISFSWESDNPFSILLFGTGSPFSTQYPITYLQTSDLSHENRQPLLYPKPYNVPSDRWPISFSWESDNPFSICCWSLTLRYWSV